MWNLCCLQIKLHHNKQKVRRIVSFYVCCYNVTRTTTSALSSTLFSHLWTHKHDITGAHNIFTHDVLNLKSTDFIFNFFRLKVFQRQHFTLGKHFHSRKIFERQLRMNQAWYDLNTTTAWDMKYGKPGAQSSPSPVRCTKTELTFTLHSSECGDILERIQKKGTHVFLTVKIVTI